MSSPTHSMPSRPESSAFRLLSCVRFDEVCVLQGAPLLGAMFSIGTLDLDKALLLAGVLLGNFALVAHVFALNDWSGIHGDLRDPARAGSTFTEKGVSRASLGSLAIFLLAVALAIFWLVGVAPLLLALVIAGASALYSAPGFHLKGRPVLGSALHLVGGLLHFLLGYAAFGAIDGRGVAVGGFFALVFTAGHLTHEARGYEGDLLNGIRTNAVAFGQRRSFVAGLVLFTAAYAWLVALAAFGIVPRVLALAGLLYPVQLRMSLGALHGGLTLDSLCRLQRGYRLLHALIGVAMLVTVYVR